MFFGACSDGGRDDGDAQGGRPGGRDDGDAQGGRPGGRDDGDAQGGRPEGGRRGGDGHGDEESRVPAYVDILVFLCFVRQGGGGGLGHVHYVIFPSVGIRIFLGVPPVPG